MEDHDRLNALPLELQLYIAHFVGERCDRAALALASPRLLGLAACRQLPSYQGLEMSLAFHRVIGGAIDEQLLRTYASRSVGNARKLRRRLKWLTRLAAAAGLRKELRLIVSGTNQTWYLVQPDCPVGTLLVARRYGKPKARTVIHFEGEEGAERMVSFGNATSGKLTAYEGEKGAERIVRVEVPSGDVGHFMGEKDDERLVRIERGSGELPCIWSEGTAPVPCIWTGGEVWHFEGETDAERLVRIELPFGDVAHYQGKQHAVRLVRYELPYGGVIHFDGMEGETDALSG